jgi:hypothetical protein
MVDFNIYPSFGHADQSGFLPIQKAIGIWKCSFIADNILQETIVTHFNFHFLNHYFF